MNNKTEKRKSIIADKAIDVFFEKGYKSTSLKDIATEADISKAGIYHYFKTKEEILAYIFIRYESESFKAYQTAKKDLPVLESDPVNKLKFIIRTYAKISLRNTKVAILSLRERHQLTGANYEKHLKEEKKIFGILKNEISAIPIIKKTYDINALVFQIISMSVWIGYWQKENGFLTRQEVIEQNINVICHGVFSKTE
ncbi:MAG: TetR/AcrR family transcriptional regulator [Desulfobacula sp.]|nr:TetR/AcrR family transcriptional regulator [Desulfobacula sp.]